MFLQHLFPPRVVPSPLIFLRGCERSCSVLPPCPCHPDPLSRSQEQVQEQQGVQRGRGCCLAGLAPQGPPASSSTRRAPTASLPSSQTLGWPRRLC